MLDTLGSLINNLSTTNLVVLVILALTGLLLLWGIPFSAKNDFVKNLVVILRQRSSSLTSNVKTQVEQLSKKARNPKGPKKEDLVGKYLTKNIFNKEKKVIGLRGNLISEEIVREAEKEDLLSALEQNSANWPPKI